MTLTAKTPDSDAGTTGPSRLRLRRKLLLWSIPVLVLLLLAAAKLAGVAILGNRLPGQFAAHDATAMQSTLRWIDAGKLGRGYREQLATGNMIALGGDYPGALEQFKSAHDQAPGSCAPRANFVLVSEMLSDRELQQGNFFAARNLLEPAVPAATGDRDCFATDHGASPIVHDFVAQTPDRVSDKLDALKNGRLTKTPDGYDYLRTPGGGIDLKGGGAPCDTQDEAQLRQCIMVRDDDRQRRLAEAQQQATPPAPPPGPAAPPLPPPPPGAAPGDPGVPPAPPPIPGPDGVQFPGTGPGTRDFCRSDGTPLGELSEDQCLVGGPGA